MPHELGIVGGTFDPPHIGHLLVATHAQRQLGLERVLLVVANQPWQKTGQRTISEAQDRLALVAAACTGHPGLEPSTIEIDHGGDSYMIDTVEKLRADGVTGTPWLILGSDAAAGLDTWHRHEELREMVHLAVAGRPGGGTPPDPWEWTDIEIPAMDVSSTDIRRRREQGLPVDVLVPRPVEVAMDQRGIHLPNPSPVATSS